MTGPEVSVVGGKVVVTGLDDCPLCHARFVAWDTGVSLPAPVPGRSRSRLVQRAYARLRCAQGHLTEL